MTTVDAPHKIISDYVEVSQEDGPWGARGIGEHPMIAPGPAIANAIYDALGIRFTDMPLTAERILLALQELQRKKDSAELMVVADNQ